MYLTLTRNNALVSKLKNYQKPLCNLLKIFFIVGLKVVEISFMPDPVKCDETSGKFDMIYTPKWH